MQITDISKFKTVHVVIVSLCGIIVALVIFQAGVFVGYNKAIFADRMAGEYSRMYEGRGKGPVPGMMGSFSGRDMPGGHGAAGKVVEISLPVIEVADSNNIEKQIITSSSTIVRNMREAVSLGSVKVGDFVVVIGSPNIGGQIDAKLIRLMPEPSLSASSTPNSPIR